MTALTPEQKRALIVANEVERLQSKLHIQEQVIAGLTRAWDLARDERDRLRAHIEGAPHDQFGCGLVRAQQRTDHCNCWKADALG